MGPWAQAYPPVKCYLRFMDAANGSRPATQGGLARAESKLTAEIEKLDAKQTTDNRRTLLVYDDILGKRDTRITALEAKRA